MQLQFRWKLHSIRKMQKPLQIYPKRTKFTLCQYSLHILFWLWFSKEMLTFEILWNYKVINQTQTVNSSVFYVVSKYWGLFMFMIFHNLTQFLPSIYPRYLRNLTGRESLHYFTIDWCFGKLWRHFVELWTGRW